MFGDSENVIGIQGVKARDVAQRPTAHRAARTTKSSLTPNGNSAEAEQAQSMGKTGLS